MCLSRRVDSALAVHRDIHPCPSHGQMEGQTMGKAISYQQPQQQEYCPLPQTPFTSLLLYPQYFREKTKLGPPCALPQLGGSIQGSKAAGKPQQDGKERTLNSRQTLGCCSSPAVEGIQTLLLVGHLQLLTTVPGLGALQGSCLLMHRRGTARRHCQPPREMGKGVWSCKSVPFNPSLHRDVRICRSRTARIFLLFLKSCGDKKKKK